MPDTPDLILTYRYNPILFVIYMFEPRKPCIRTELKKYLQVLNMWSMKEHYYLQSRKSPLGGSLKTQKHQ